MKDVAQVCTDTPVFPFTQRRFNIISEIIKAADHLRDLYFMT